MSVRAIRGAIQVEANTPESIAAGTKELLAEILQANSLTPSSVISVILTATPDLNAAFPAAAAREVGFEAVPLLCAVEIDVPGALPRTIRAPRLGAGRMGFEAAVRPSQPFAHEAARSRGRSRTQATALARRRRCLSLLHLAHPGRGLLDPNL